MASFLTPPGGWSLGRAPPLACSPLSSPILRSRLFWATAPREGGISLILLLSLGLEQVPPTGGSVSQAALGGGVLRAGGRGWWQPWLEWSRESHWLFLPVTLPAPHSCPGPLSTCVQCLILAFLFSGLGFAGFSAMAKSVLPENSLWKLPFGWGWAPGEASTQLSLGGRGSGGRQGLRRGSGPAVVGENLDSSPCILTTTSVSSSPRLLFQGPWPCFPALWTVGEWLREAEKACSLSSPCPGRPAQDEGAMAPQAQALALRMGRPTHRVRGSR